MKKILLMLVLFFVLSGNLYAGLNRSALNSRMLVTEQMLLVTQLDVISLVLSTREINYVSYIGDDKVIHVDTALLEGAAVKAQSGDVKEIVKPHIQKYLDALRIRMNYFTPKVFDSFDVNKDIVFDIYVGKTKKESLYGGSLELVPVPTVEEGAGTPASSVKDDKTIKGIIGTRIKNITE